MTPAPLTRALDRGSTAFLCVLAVLAATVPALNLLLPPSSPLHVPTYLVSLFGKYVCYALLALAIDLIWGYCGILSLGHGAFFALGGYAMGMYLMRQIGTRGVYAHPVLPDFMVFLNWPELPVYWYGFQYFPYAALMVVLVPGALAFVFGWFAFRSRVTGVYLSIITQALTYALMLGFFRNNFGFGGNNGLTDFKDILGFNVQAQGTRAALFAASAIALGLGYLVARYMVASTYGKVLVAVRDAEARTRFLSNPKLQKMLQRIPVSSVLRDFESLRFGRLCAWLRERGVEPDDQVAYSILIYRLSDRDLQQALDGPPPEMSRGRSSRGGGAGVE